MATRVVRKNPTWMMSAGARNRTKTTQSMRLTGPRIMVSRLGSAALAFVANCKSHVLVYRAARPKVSIEVCPPNGIDN